MGNFEYFTTAMHNPDRPTCSVFGLSAALAGLSKGRVQSEPHTKIDLSPDPLLDSGHRPFVALSVRQRLPLYRALAPKSDVLLKAGQELRLADFGLYGFGMVCSPTFGDALRFSLDHISSAEPMVMQISLRTAGRDAILKSHGYEFLGELLPMYSEFWRSSLSRLFSLVLESPFPSTRMAFPFSAPPHWRSYKSFLNCNVEFDAGVLEWHFSSDLLERPNPGANRATADLCAEACQRLNLRLNEPFRISEQVKAVLLTRSGHTATAEIVAERLNMSLRTLYRRLSEEGLTYKKLADDIRRETAIGLLENSRETIDTIAERVGFAEATSFRKAFRKWTGCNPTDYRRAHLVT